MAGCIFSSRSRRATATLMVCISILPWVVMSEWAKRALVEGSTSKSLPQNRRAASSCIGFTSAHVERTRLFRSGVRVISRLLPGRGAGPRRSRPVGRSCFAALGRGHHLRYRELGGVARDAREVPGGRGGYGPSHPNLRAGLEGEGGVAPCVSGYGLLADELLALVAPRGIGEELDHVGDVTRVVVAVELARYGGCGGGGLGRGYYRFVLQVVGSGVSVAGVVCGRNVGRVVLARGHEIYTQTPVGKDRVAREGIANALGIAGYADTLVQVEGYRVGASGGTVTD